MINKVSVIRAFKFVIKARYVSGFIQLGINPVYHLVDFACCGLFFFFCWRHFGQHQLVEYRIPKVDVFAFG